MTRIGMVMMVGVVVSSGSAFAAPPVKPPAPPEVKKTVDAFAGTWKMDAMLTVPGAPAPMKVKAKLACKKAVAGKAVTCAMGGKIPGMPTYEAAVMIGYDVAGKAVHFMAMSTEDEVHDHRCVWKDEKSLVCDPLKGASMGQAMTEELSFTFDGKTVVQRSVSTFADGSKVIFEGTGKK